jgi:hypothetical protein
MKFVESLPNEPILKSQEELFNRTGDNPVDDKDRVFAKFLKVELGNGDVQKKYFVLTYNNAPYDPNGIDSHREKTLNMQLKTTSQKTFDYYVAYLKARNPIYMTKAQRSYING